MLKKFTHSEGKWKDEDLKESDLKIRESLRKYKAENK
jgi:endoglucanase